MGYKYRFTDNETYGVDDINAVSSRLLSSGVVFYPENENMLNGMNSITSELAADGVEYNLASCMVEDAEEGFIKIGKGTAFFEDGVSITIDEGGITMPKVKESYVYLYHDIERNTCYAKMAAELPELRFVPLGYIDADGKITDKRKYAVSKLAPNASYKCFTHTGDVIYNNITTDAEIFLFEMNIGHPNYNYIGFQNDQWETFGFAAFGDDGYTPYLKICHSRHGQIRFKKEGDAVKVYLRRNNDAQYVEDVKFVVF